MGAVEVVIIVLVVGGRIFLPLLIPYVPVVGLLSCLLLDMVDQTIFQQFPGINLEGYQSYDKALDVYYLAIAYLSTFRNWTSAPAFRVSQLLFYYRLFGMLLFELSQARWLLFVFPNTFEYFFLFIELCRLRWDQRRFGWTLSIAAAALIWVFVKLPQEWWIHLARRDFTDAVSAHPWVVIPIAGVVVAVAAAAWWVVRYKAAPADHRPRLRADPLPVRLTGEKLYREAKVKSAVFDRFFAQKALLIGAIVVMFLQFLVTTGAGPVETVFWVSVFVALSALASQWLARLGHWRSLAVEVGGMLLVNIGIVLVLELFDDLPLFTGITLPAWTLLFMVFLITLLTVLFDRYHLVHWVRQLVREREAGRERPATGTQASPVVVIVEQPRESSRLLALLAVLIWPKFLALVFHAVVALIWGIAALLFFVVSQVVVIFTSRYPEGRRRFIARYLRWTNLVIAWACGLTDVYPPLRPTDEVSPVVTVIPSTETSSRRWAALALLFVKLVAVAPHAVVLYFLWLVMGVLVWVANLVVLFTGRYPLEILDFVVAVLRWQTRLSVFILGLSDEYPPLQLDRTEIRAEIRPELAA